MKSPLGFAATSHECQTVVSNSDLTSAYIHMDMTIYGWDLVHHLPTGHIDNGPRQGAGII